MLRHRSIAISGQSARICLAARRLARKARARQATGTRRASMNVLSYTKTTIAIVGAVVLVGAARWVAADVYRVTYPDKPGYLVPDVKEPPVDRAALDRSWPQALETEKSRAGLLSYMRHM